MSRERKKADEQQIDLTPMLDVVFIMLIFFIVTATFLKPAGIEVDSPRASTAVVQEKANILIAITANGLSSSAVIAINPVEFSRKCAAIRTTSSLRPELESAQTRSPFLSRPKSPPRGAENATVCRCC